MKDFLQFYDMSGPFLCFTTLWTEEVETKETLTEEVETQETLAEEVETLNLRGSGTAHFI